MAIDAEGARDSLYNRVGAEELRRRLLEGAPLVAQGPMGSLFLSQFQGEGVPAAAWSLSEPQLVERLHGLYLAAGADVAVTNTFQASAPALERDAVRASVAEVNRLAVDCARRAGARLLLGSVGPCGISWDEEDSPAFRAARAAYREQAAALLAAGADGVLLETFTSLTGLRAALLGARDAACGMPVLASVTCDGEGRLLADGAPLERAAALAEELGADALGLNCMELEAAAGALRRLAGACDLPLMVRPNAGDPVRDEEGNLIWSETPAAFAEACRTWLELGVRMVGSCCGTSARTTCALAESVELGWAKK